MQIDLVKIINVKIKISTISLSFAQMKCPKIVYIFYCNDKNKINV